jgi:hypothetical protein
LQTLERFFHDCAEGFNRPSANPDLGAIMARYAEAFISGDEQAVLKSTA